MDLWVAYKNLNNNSYYFLFRLSQKCIQSLKVNYFVSLIFPHIQRV